jgi:ankyrin repeat protein
MRCIAFAILATVLLTDSLQAQHTEALFDAIAADDAAQVSALLAAGADPNVAVDRDGVSVTPLGKVIDRQGSAMFDIVGLLLDAGADPNGTYGASHDLITPLVGALHAEMILHYEDGAGQGDLMRHLLDAGADPSVVHCGHFGPGSLAQQASLYGLDHILELLAEAGAEDVIADPELRVLSPFELALTRHDAPLHAALLAGDVEAVERLLAEGHDPRQLLVGRTLLNGEVERYGPLGIALVFSRHFIVNPVAPEASAAIAHLLLAAGADPDEMIEPVCESFHMPAFVGALYSEQPDLARALLAAGASPHIPAVNAGGTVRVPPLIMAVAENDEEIVRLLLEAGADPNATATDGSETQTAWQVAVESGHHEIARILSEAGAEELPLPAGARHDTADDPHEYPVGAYGDDFAIFDQPDPFDDAFATCEPGASKDADAGGWAAVRYDIVGPEDDRCRVAMTYTTNPNPKWVDRPLTMLLDPESPFYGQVMAAFEACLSGDHDHFDCQGPLLEQLR